MKARILAALLVAMGLTGCISGGKQFLYVTGPGTNEVFQFQIHSNGALTALTPENSAAGSNPVAVLIHPPGDFAYIANFLGNNVTLLAVNKGNGQLSVPVNTNPIPPSTPPNIFAAGTGPIAMAMGPAGTFLYVANQGSGNITGFTIDPTTGNLGAVAGSPFLITPGNTPASHPRSIAVSPKGNFLFVTDPALGTVASFSIDAHGVLTESAGSPFALGAGATPAFVTVEATGRFVYVTDPAHNSVLAFSIQSGGSLSPITGSPFAAGNQPGAMTSGPQGAALYVANQGSNDVSAFVIDSNTGALGAVTGSPFLTGGKGPSYLAASSTFLYVTDATTNDVAAFTIGSNGALKAVVGSPFNVPTSPTWVTLVSE